MICSDLRVHSAIRCTLGECPLWDIQGNALYWIDSLECTLYRMDGSGDLQVWRAPQEIGSFTLCRDGGALCALRDGVYQLDFTSGKFDRFASTPNDPAKTRLNDGKCDRKGRYWVGSLTEDMDRIEGALYRIDPDGSVTECFDGIRVSNGLAFPHDAAFFYHSDSRIGRVDRITQSDSVDGKTQRSIFYQTDPLRARPDGAALDREGHYWSALYGAGEVIRISPAGEVVFRLPLPTAYPTMIAFGGADLRTLFVTTARTGLMDASTINDPLAGKVLSIETEVPGLPEPRFAA